MSASTHELGRRRRLRAAAGLLLALAAAAPAPPGAQGLMAGWGIAPRYESLFEVRRRETRWDQTLKVDRSDPRLADLSGSLRIASRQDEARNDFEESDNVFRLEGGRETGLGRLTLQGQTQRNWREDKYSLTVRDNDQLRLSQLVPLLSGPGTQVSLSGGGGWLQERQVSENRRGNRTTRNDTESSGWQGDLGLTTRWEPRQALRVTGTAGWDGARQPALTRVTEEGVDSLLATSDRSRTLTLRSDAEWTGWTALKLNLQARYTNDLSRFYQASVQTQETKRSLKRGLTLALGGDPLSGIGYEVQLSTDQDDYDYEVQRNDRLAAADALRMRTHYALGLPLLRGSTLTAGARASNRRAARENTTAYDTRERGVEAGLTRPLGTRLELAASIENELQQDFYDDGKLDRDRLRLESSLGLTYRPSPRLLARGSYTARQSEIINIRRQRATQNQINEDYRITADYQALLPAAISIRQSFQVSADYTYFVFDEEQNKLTRTNRVTSKLTVPLWTESLIYLEHIYNRSDTGAYVYSPRDGGRAYGRASASLRQYLKAEVKTVLAGLLRLRAEEVVDINTRRDLARGVTTRRDKRTFTGEAGIERIFSNGMRVNATFAHTMSTQEDDFWNIQATLVKTFR
ncbi:MAG: hypothetical protein FJY75_00510 [Candidatus Eisenbacteria bacterium]|uniref:TIGR03016 family PEP-CTERM system-associated outer membrane protein n=1 Tax=Eiseniibacteriota bacterium TaxID=2212470 RepID=A0A937X879_UNCEI|nr:hypothetical protein [Candidatus Eisenbacteria bacterium]